MESILEHLAEMESLLDTLEQGVVSSCAIRQQLTEEKTALTGENELLKTENSSLKQQVADMAQQLSSLTKEMEQAQQQLSSMEQRLQMLEDDKAALPPSTDDEHSQETSTTPRSEGEHLNSVPTTDEGNMDDATPFTTKKKRKKSKAPDPNQTLLSFDFLEP